ncbi:ATP-binding protein [Desulfopila aestuarii]|uniref:histidine kinase n=1 Tax=Desulfopila aestuarii DSM 18488 TaxID=1121416 RepID=A0A1M7YKT4_9BACT|nr:ATP-binding protein [Desulfopila aestuarii]SHO53240.1 PAS domain-containing protein [Desulfopila aestuarii DSM 18488]
MATKTQTITRQVGRTRSLAFGLVMLVIMLIATSISGYFSYNLQKSEENRLAGTIGTILSESINRISFSGKYHSRILLEEMQKKLPELAYISVETLDGIVEAHTDSTQNDTPITQEERDLNHHAIDGDTTVITEKTINGVAVKEVLVPYRTGLRLEPSGVVRIGINVNEARSKQLSNLFIHILIIIALTISAVWIMEMLSRRFSRRLNESEQALRESNDLFTLFMRHSPFYAFIKDVTPSESRVLQASDNYRQMIGITGSDMVGKTMAELFPADLAATITADDWAVVSNNKVLQVDEELNGRSYTSIKFPIIQGGRTLLAGYTIDITERKKSEDLLSYSNSLTTAALESTPDAILVVKRDGKIARWNQKFVDLWKVPEGLLDTTIDDPVLQHVTAQMAQPETFLAKVLELYDHPEDSSVDTLFLADGRVVERYSQPLQIKDEIVGRFWSFRNITERKRMEDALQASESRLLEAQKMADVGNWELDVATGRIWASDLAYDMYGLKPSPDNTIELSKVKDCTVNREIVRQAMVDLIEKDEPYNMEIDVEPANGNEPLSIRSIAKCIRDEEGRPVKVVGVIQNITEMKRAENERLKLEAQLQQAQKMELVGLLAGGVAHDFNNILGVIIGHADLAMAPLNPSHPLFAHLEAIRKAANHSADITRQLLAFARKQTIAPKVISLNEAIEGTLNMLRRLIGEDIELTWRPGESLWAVKVDPSQIDQILANLCINARAAISGVGNITVETCNCTMDDGYLLGQSDFIPGDYVRISLSDNGCGMDQETLSHIFEPFFTTKGIGKGTGLGLATVYGAVKQNRGFINVYSEPGKGTSFTIYLPRHSGKAINEIHESTAEQVVGGNETILLVEDDSAILNMTTMMLQSLGYTVFSATFPSEAIRLTDEFSGKINLLITDMVMPEMNGRDLAKHILANQSGLKCLFMSGYTADIIANQGILDEGVCFIQKPFSRNELAKKIRSILELKGS